LIPWVYSDVAWSRVAELATLAFDLYSTDNIAKQIVEQAAEEIVLSVTICVQRIGLASEGPFPVVLAGGVLQNEIMSSLVTAKLQSALPSAEILHPKVSPALGAALLCLQGTHVSVSATV